MKYEQYLNEYMEVSNSEFVKDEKKNEKISGEVNDAIYNLMKDLMDTVKKECEKIASDNDIKKTDFIQFTKLNGDTTSGELQNIFLTCLRDQIKSSYGSY